MYVGVCCCMVLCVGMRSFYSRCSIALMRARVYRCMSLCVVVLWYVLLCHCCVIVLCVYMRFTVWCYCMTCVTCWYVVLFVVVICGIVVCCEC